jgi:hypothetical protein
MTVLRVKSSTLFTIHGIVAGLANKFYEFLHLARNPGSNRLMNEFTRALDRPHRVAQVVHDRALQFALDMARREASLAFCWVLWGSLFRA